MSSTPCTLRTRTTYGILIVVFCLQLASALEPLAGTECFSSSVSHSGCGCAANYGCHQFKNQFVGRMMQVCGRQGGIDSNTGDQCPQFAGRCTNPTSAPGMSSWCCCVKSGIDCATSEWTPWGTCSALCGGGKQSRTREVTVEPFGQGAPCPALREQRQCATQSCSPNEVYAWGKGKWGRLGIDQDQDVSIPTNIGVLRGYTVQQIGAGYQHTLALTQRGTVYVWGRNWNGQLGVGPKVAPIPMEWPTPRLVEGLEDFTVTQIASGSYHSLALTQKQKVLMWGWNNEGEAGTGSTQPQSVLRPELITSLDDEKIVRISAGSAHTVALSDSGHVFVWGMHTHGQLGIGRGAPKIIKSPIQLHAMDGVNVTNMACGLYHNLLLTAQGTVWAFGDNTFGSVGTGDNKYVHYFPQKVGALQSKQVIGVAAGAYHSLAVTDQGEVYAWGDNSEGQLGISNHTAQEIWRPAKVSMDHIGPNTTIVQVAAGHSHSLALTSDGIVLAWGSDSNGQCGLGRTGKKQKTLVPTIVHNLTGLNVTQVAAGMFDSFAVSAPGSWLHEPPEEIPVTKSPTFAAVPASLAPSYAPSVVGDTQSPATGNPTNAPSGPGKTGLTSRPSIATAIGWGHASIPPATAGTPPWKAPATVDAPMPGTQPGEDTLVVSKPLVIACAVGLVLVLLAGAAACFVLKRPRQGDFHHLPEDMSDRNDIELSEPESDRSNRRPIKRLRRKIKQKLHEKKAKGRGYGHLGDPDDGSESPSASGTDAESDSSAGNSPSPTKRADPSLASRVANKTLKPKNLQYARVDEEASGSLERNVSDRISPASAEAEADLLSMDPQPSTSATPAAKPPSSDEDVLGIFR